MIDRSRSWVMRLGRLTSMLLCAALLFGCASRSQRPDPQPLPPNPGLIGVVQAWQIKLPALSFPLQPAVHGQELVLASDDGSMVRLDARNGQALQQFSAGQRLSAGVGSDGSTLAVVTADNHVLAFHQGQEIWRQSLATQSYTAPLVAGGRVFVLGADRSVVALDGRTGARLWRHKREGEGLVLRQQGLLTAVGNTLIAGIGGRMTGMDPDTGGVLWEAPVAVARGTNDIEGLIDLMGPAARSGNTLCVRAFQTSVACVDAQTGQILWQQDDDGLDGLASDGQHLFAAESDGLVRAWQMTDGQSTWRNTALRWRTLGSPLVLGRSVVFGEDTGNLYFLSREDGHVLDRVFTHKSGIATTPVLVADTLVVMTRDGHVYAYRPG